MAVPVVQLLAVGALDARAPDRRRSGVLLEGGARVDRRPAHREEAPALAEEAREAARHGEGFEDQRADRRAREGPPGCDGRGALRPALSAGAA